MLVPRFWAEHRIQLREGRGPQTTIRRWGWSGSSQTEAEQHARQRAEAVAAEVQAGKKLSLAERRERKVAYNGADGVPIREEVLRDHPDLDAVVTRNQYGAHCLNVRDVLFADVDLEPGAAQGDADGVVGCLGFLLAAAGAGVVTQGWWWPGLLLFAVALGLYLWRRLRRRRQRQRLASPEWISRRADQWCAEHPSWSLHLYRTPAGYRLLATHAVFDPGGEDTAAFFQFFAVDPRFARMCRAQRCFRARLTGKPWRMGVKGRMGWGAWPPTTDKAMARREEWITRYEMAAAGFSACRFIAQVGAAVEHPRATAIRHLHDESCRARTDLPLA